MENDETLQWNKNVGGREQFDLEDEKEKGWVQIGTCWVRRTDGHLGRDMSLKFRRQVWTRDTRDTNLGSTSIYVTSFNPHHRFKRQLLIASFDRQENRSLPSHIVGELRFVTWFIWLQSPCSIIPHYMPNQEPHNFQLGTFYFSNLFFSVHMTFTWNNQNGCTEKNIFPEITVMTSRFFKKSDFRNKVICVVPQYMWYRDNRWRTFPSPLWSPQGRLCYCIL